MFRQRRAKFRPTLESLEGRLCLSAVPAAPITDLARAEVRVYASDYLLELDGIKGESANYKQHTNESALGTFWAAGTGDAWPTDQLSLNFAKLPADAPAPRVQLDSSLNLTGMNGEAASDKHKGTIEIDSFSWSTTPQSAHGAGGGGGAGKAVFQDIHFTMAAARGAGQGGTLIPVKVKHNV